MRARGGWAALIEQAGTVREVSGGADGTTQNRIELTAMCEALETLTEVIHVFTDGDCVEKCFNEKWHERWLRDGSLKGSNGPGMTRDPWVRVRFGMRRTARRDVHVDQGHKPDYPNNVRVDPLAQGTALAAS